MTSAYDSYLPAFALMIPSLVQAYDSLPADDPLKLLVPARKLLSEISRVEATKPTTISRMARVISASPWQSSP